MKSATFHHIGVACSDLEEEERTFEALGYRREREDVIDPIQGVRARYLAGAGPRIELLCNLEGRNVLSDWLKKGIKMYHTAYEVDALDAALNDLHAAGGRQLGEPVEAIAYGMRKITFVMMPNFFVIELICRL